MRLPSLRRDEVIGKVLKSGRAPVQSPHHTLSRLLVAAAAILLGAGLCAFLR